MDLTQLFVIIHLLLFVYWLGGDLGVFYSSGMVINPDLTPSARMTAAKIMINLDLVPRLCMSLMLTVGGILSDLIGVPHPTWQMVGIILLGPAWLSMVLFIHLNEGKPIGKTVTRVDYWFRWALVIYLLFSTGISFAFGELGDHPWVGGKLVVFAGMVFCGLMIRKFLPPYGAGIHQLMAGSITDEANAAMAQSLNKVRPFVIAIWVGLLIECYLGVVKPGGQQVAEVLALAPIFGN